MILRHATVVDGTLGERRTASVVVEGKTIREVVDLPEGSDSGEEIDLRGLTVLPGLIDLHTHLGVISAANQHLLSPARLAADIFENARLALQAGFTTVRECGGLDGGVAEVIESGAVAGPRVLPAGPILCQSGGHGDLRPRFREDSAIPGVYGLGVISERVDGADAMRAAARRAFRNGATHLKVCLSGGVISSSDEIDDLQLSEHELRAAVEEARQRASYVTAHAMTNASVRHGLSAGVECFEHVPRLDRPTADALREAGAAYVSTLAVTQLMVEQWQAWGIPESALPRLGDLAEAARAALACADEAGVLTGSGSDLLGPAQNRRGLELALKAEVVGAPRAINMATEQNARILRRPDLGIIAAGKRADLIVVDFDPYESPQSFDDPDRIKLVMKDGVIAKNLLDPTPHQG